MTLAVKHSLIVMFVILTGATLACSMAGAQALPTDAPTPTAITATFAPIVTATVANTLQPAPTGTPNNCKDDKTRLGQRYDVDAKIDVEAHTATVTMQATYRNDTTTPLSQLVMNIEPNRKPGQFSLNKIDGDEVSTDATFSLTGPRLELGLKSPLQPGCETTLSLAFSVKAPAILQSYVQNTGYFGYSDRQFNLGQWLPQFAELRNGEFYTPQEWPLGEYEVTELSDFAVAVQLTGKNADKQIVIGPGATQRSGDVWRFRLIGGRTFTLSITASQKLITAKSDDGITIELYYFLPEQTTHQTETAVISSATATSSPTSAPTITVTATPSPTPNPIPTSAQWALDTAKNAINRYTLLFGPMSVKRMVVVEGDFPDGIEFSGLVFVSEHWFSVYTNQPDSWLTLITAHEIAHQWFYSQVGNDQGYAPFMDETLAVYSEILYIQDKFPKLADWWWAFRVLNYTPGGYVDSRIYDHKNLRDYLNAVYLRGALMLHEIRKTIGDEAFLKWLRDYHDARAGKIATPADFWGAMQPADYQKIAAIRARYLHDPDPLHLTPATAVATKDK